MSFRETVDFVQSKYGTRTAQVVSRLLRNWSTDAILNDLSWLSPNALNTFRGNYTRGLYTNEYLHPANYR